MDCFGWIPEREESISPAYFHGWLPNYLSHVFALLAPVMDQFLCTWSCLTECRCYLDVNQVWPRVYVNAKRACYFGWWSDGDRRVCEYGRNWMARERRKMGYCSWLLSCGLIWLSLDFVTKLQKCNNLA